MKLSYLIIIWLFLFQTSMAQKFEGVFVFDNEEILLKEQEMTFNNLFQNHEKNTSNEIVLVTTPNYAGHESMMFFAVEFGDNIGVGKKDKNNGVVIAISKEQRQIFIATGYGTELILKDEIVKKFIDSLIIPKFKEDKYYEGLLAGSTAIIEFLEQPENMIK